MLEIGSKALKGSIFKFGGGGIRGKPGAGKLLSKTGCPASGLGKAGGKGTSHEKFNLVSMRHNRGKIVKGGKGDHQGAIVVKNDCFGLSEGGKGVF